MASYATLLRDRVTLRCRSGVHNVALKKRDTLRASSMWFLAGQALRTFLSEFLERGHIAS
jgi:hypothetical protein